MSFFFFCVQLLAKSVPPRFDLKISENLRFAQKRKKAGELHFISKKFLELHIIFYYGKTNSSTNRAQRKKVLQNLV